MREEGSTPAKGAQGKWVKGDIWTRCVDGMRPVSAETCGPFAVHRTIDGPGWRVTHVHIGYAFPHFFESRAEAKRIAKVLLTIEPVNFWTSQSTPPKKKSAWLRRARKAFITAMKEIGAEYE